MTLIPHILVILSIKIGTSFKICSLLSQAGLKSQIALLNFRKCACISPSPLSQFPSVLGCLRRFFESWILSTAKETLPTHPYCRRPEHLIDFMFACNISKIILLGMERSYAQICKIHPEVFEKLKICFGYGRKKSRKKYFGIYRKYYP